MNISHLGTLDDIQLVLKLNGNCEMFLYKTTF